MTSKRDLSRRVDDLATDARDDDGPDEIVFTDYVVDENGENPEPFARTRIWRDEHGEWCTERAEL